MRESGGGPDARRPLCFPTFRGSLRLLELALALAPVVFVELLDETGPEDTSAAISMSSLCTADG
jgi:hypothetical protein